MLTKTNKTVIYMKRKNILCMMLLAILTWA